MLQSCNDAHVLIKQRIGCSSDDTILTGGAGSKFPVSSLIVMLVDVRMISLSVGGTGSRGAFAACCVESTRAAARRRCLKRLNPVFSGMILIYRHPDENTFPRRSRPAASSLAESFITLSALNSFLFNKWIKVFHSTARYTPFEEMRPALTKWFLAQERKKKSHIIASS